MNWKTELGLGAIMIIIGGVLTWQFNPQILVVLEGAVPLLLIIIGALFLWIAYEDKTVEAELKKIEKELEKETQQSRQEASTESSS
jgi:4-hydroxybenzoate polyprenyltransferase